MKDIVDTALSVDSFSTLCSLVISAGLVDTLRGPGPYTVFAPGNEAFAKVPKETLDALAADPKGALTKVLTYHVVPGKMVAADITDQLEVGTAEGSKLKFNVKGDSITINEATIVQTDIEATNGVIHVIDAVILPPAT